MTHKSGFLTLAAGLVLALGTSVSPTHAGVEVDLSVLDGSIDATTTPPVVSNDLKMPGTSYPRSEYVGPPVAVSAPAPAPRVAAPTPSPEPAPAPDPAPAPEPVAAPEPAPEPIPEPAPAPEPAAPAVAEVETPPAAPPTIEVSESSASASAAAPPPPPEPESLSVEPTPSAPEPDTASNEAVEESETSAAQDNGATESAALTASPASEGSRITFDGVDTRLPDGAASMLDPIAAQASSSDDVRIQLRAYAGGESVSASKARRLSLSRALAVRSYLIEQGVRSTRIDVRALGDKSDEQPINRVDIEVGTP